MKRIYNLPIYKKLLALIVLSSGVSLLVAAAAIVVYDSITYTQQSKADLKTQAEIIASNSTAALAFNDPKTATEYLLALKAKPSIVQAAIYGSDRRLFARYARGGRVLAFPESIAEGVSIDGDDVILFHVIRQDGKPIGTVYLRSSLQLTTRLYSYGVIVLVVMIAALFIGILASSKLQRFISKPILEIARVAGGMIHTGDYTPRPYTERAVKHGEDEIGMLTDAFNRMLSHIESRDAALIDANTALSEQEARLSQIIECSPHGMVMFDEEGRIQLVNAELEASFGYSRGQLLQEPIETLIAKRFRQDYKAMREAYWLNPQPSRLGVEEELCGLRSDGTEFRIEIGLKRVDMPEGLLMLASIADITDRVRYQTNFRRIIEAAPYGMVMVNSEGVIVLTNGYLERLFGYVPGELLGQQIECLLPERYRGGHPKFRSGYHAEPELRLMGAGRDLMALHKDGSEFPVEIGLNPMETDHGTMVIAAITDITVRKKLELDLRQANANMEEFTSVASHDLKSPLRGISDLLTFITEDLGENIPPEVQNNLGRISLRIKRMERLISDLLSYSRAGRAATELTTIIPRDLINGVLEMQGPPSSFKIIVNSRSRPFQGVKTPLETVLRNLISNAIKHHDHPTGCIEITVEEDDSECIFTVADDGPGIPEIAHERVFKLFQTISDKKDETSGIGLAVAKRMVECHGGRIIVESKDGVRGTIFKFWWPRFARKDLDDKNT